MNSDARRERTGRQGGGIVLQSSIKQHLRWDFLHGRRQSTDKLRGGLRAAASRATGLGGEEFNVAFVFADGAVAVGNVRSGFGPPGNPAPLAMDLLAFAALNRHADLSCCTLVCNAAEQSFGLSQRTAE
ncbi:MAG: hypothetical protein AMXMBFR82_20020 [Candidatus Hydrogenedentota bacterium]